MKKKKTLKQSFWRQKDLTIFSSFNLREIHSISFGNKHNYQDLNTAVTTEQQLYCKAPAYTQATISHGSQYAEYLHHSTNLLGDP